MERTGKARKKEFAEINEKFIFQILRILRQFQADKLKHHSLTSVS